MGTNSQLHYGLMQKTDTIKKQKIIYQRSMREIFRFEIEEEYGKALALLRQMQLKRWDFITENLHAKADKILKLLWLDKALKNIKNYIANQNHTDACDLLERIFDRCSPGELPMKFLDRIEQAKEEIETLKFQLQKKQKNYLVRLVAICSGLLLVVSGILFLIYLSFSKSHFSEEQFKKLMSFKRKNVLKKDIEYKNTLLSEKSNDKSLVVSWKVKGNVDFIGFHVWRSERENGDYVRVTKSLITTKDTSHTFLDRYINNTQDYFYRIEKINSNGNSSFFDSF